MSTSTEDGLQVELALYRARSAARAGDLDEAGRLLAELDAEPVSAAVLDLMARVHAQRGDLAEADRCWAQVQRIASDDVAAANGRRLIKRIRAGRRRTRPIATTGRVTATAALVVCALLTGGATWLVSAEFEAKPAADSDGQQLAQEREHNKELRDRLATITEQQVAAQDERTRVLDAIAATLAMPGVVVERREDDVRVVFESGLFGGNGTAVNGQGVALLTELGRRLAGLSSAKTTVIGHAAAVPGGATSGGAVIALDRARAAAQHLAAGGGLPLTAFTLVSADQSAGPFADLARNRTVTMQITPR